MPFDVRTKLKLPIIFGWQYNKNKNNVERNGERTANIFNLCIRHLNIGNNGFNGDGAARPRWIYSNSSIFEH